MCENTLVGRSGSERTAKQKRYPVSWKIFKKKDQDSHKKFSELFGKVLCRRENKRKYSLIRTITKDPKIGCYIRAH